MRTMPAAATRTQLATIIAVPPPGSPRPSAKLLLRIYLAIAALLTLAQVVGCASLQGQKANAEDLQATVEAFNSSVRWGDFRTASAMIPDRDQDKFWEDAETFKQNTRIANLEIRTVKIEGLNGRAHIAFTYYRLSDPSFRSLVLHQTWRFDPDRHAWLVEDSQLHRLLP